MVTSANLRPTLFADRQARSGVIPPWSNGKNGKEYRATLGRKAIAGIFSVGLEEDYRWKDSVQNGERSVFGWPTESPRSYAPGSRNSTPSRSTNAGFPSWKNYIPGIYANERYLRNVDPLARVAMVYSQRTATFYGGEAARAKVEDPALGFYEALVEARIPFEMVHDHLLDAEHLKPFRTLDFAQYRRPFHEAM